ncbi:MAG TPA: hypothetical protein VL094_04030 [Sphingomonadaceae bacterium]|nr:hypothetical protein [Sphingomonadaceae bacterium]
MDITNPIYSDADNVLSALVTNVARASTLMADEARIYWSVGKEFASHGYALHAGRVFAKGDAQLRPQI